jgi:hypothetical protein
MTWYEEEMWYLAQEKEEPWKHVGSRVFTPLTPVDLALASHRPSRYLDLTLKSETRVVQYVHFRVHLLAQQLTEVLMF